MDILLIDLGKNIRGECTLPGYDGQIDVLSFSHVLMPPHYGKTTHQQFTLTKYLDASSPSLLNCCNTAATLPLVTFTVAAAAVSPDSVPSPYWILKMSNVLLASVSVGGGGGGRPVETLVLNYTTLAWELTPQGGLSASSTEASPTQEGVNLV